MLLAVFHLKIVFSCSLNPCEPHDASHLCVAPLMLSSHSGVYISGPLISAVTHSLHIDVAVSGHRPNLVKNEQRLMHLLMCLVCHGLNILDCLFVCPSILHQPMFLHAVDVSVIRHHPIRICSSSINGSLTDLRTTAGP